MATKYEILVKAVLDKTDIQSQLNQTKNKVNIKTNFDKGSIDNQVKLWQNKLETMKIKTPKVFNDKDVQSQVKNLEQLFSQYSKNIIPKSDVQVGWSNLNVAVQKVSSSLKNVNRDGYGVADMMGIAMKKMIMWAAAAEILYGTMRKIGEGIQYIRDLNKELTNIQIVSGMSKEQIGSLALQYNNLAKELGATTLEVAKGSLEWVRQGKTAEETQQLLRASVMMGKLAALDQAQSTEYLTSIMNGYNLKIEEIMPTIDKMVALDNAYATSVGEIASAMQRTSSVAKDMGVSINQLASMITVVSAKTRLPAETIGQAFKTIFTRMEAVKLNKDVDEFGESISDVEKTLRKYGIEVRDTNHSFKNMGVVMEEVMIKWKELGESGKTVDQSMIASALAGVRQANIIRALMDSQEEYNKALDITASSLGTTTERYKIYTDNIEASGNRMKAAWESAWAATINPEAIIFFNNLNTQLLEVIKNMGGFINLIAGLEPSLAKLKNITDIAYSVINYPKVRTSFDKLRDEISNVMSTGTVKGITKSINNALDLIFGTKVSVVSRLLTDILEKGSAKKQELNQKDIENELKREQLRSQVKIIETKKEDAEPVFEMGKAIDSLSKSIKNSRDILKSYTDTGDLSVEQIEKLKESYPDYMNYLTIQNGKLILNTELIKQNSLAKIDDQIALAKQSLLLNQNDTELQKNIDVLQAYKNMVEQSFKTIEMQKQLKDAEDSAKKLEKQLKLDENTFKKMQDSAIKSYEAEKKILQDQLKAFKDVQEEKLDVLEKEHDINKNNLENELDGYERIINAQLELIDLKEEEYDYNNEIADKNKEVTDIQDQLLALQFDNSQEAAAKRAELEEQLAEKNKDLSQIEHDRGIQLQKDALNKEYDDFKNNMDLKIKIVDDAFSAQKEAINKETQDFENNIQQRMDALDNYIQQARNAITDFSNDIDNRIQLMNDHIEDMKIAIDKLPDSWAKVKESISGAMAEAKSYLSVFEGLKVEANSYLDIFRGVIVNTDANIETHHEGGIVGGTSSKYGEIYAKLLKGEVVSTENDMRNMLTNIIPKMGNIMSSSNTNGNIQIGNLLEVKGDMTKDVLPDVKQMLNEAVGKLNETMRNRGYIRPIQNYAL